MLSRFPGRRVSMRFAVFAVAMLCLHTAWCAPLAPEPQYVDIASTFAEVLPAMQIEGRPLDDTIASRALSLFLTSLDGDHSFFLAGDVERFRKQVTQLDDKLRAGDVTVAFDVAETYRKRAAERCAYVKKLLAGKIDLSKKETYQWRRRGLDTLWPANQREQDELWRKKITDQYIRRVIAVELDEEKKRDSARTGATNETVTVETAVKMDERAKPESAGISGTNDVLKSGSAAVSTNAPRKAPVPEEMLSPEKFIIRQYEQFLTVMQDTDSEWVFQQYLSAFARAYDPHSEYMSQGEMDNFDISMKLSLVGIGALLTSEDGAAKVVRIIPKGPADRDGRLQPGDKIVGVGEQDQEPVNVLHWPLDKIVSRIRGQKGTRVVLAVIPAGDIGTTVKIAIDRDEVKLDEQAAQGAVKDMPEPDGTTNKMGIITLPSFYADMEGARIGAPSKSAGTDVRLIMDDMVKQGVSGMLVDLRNNGGGSLSEAVKITGLFMTLGPVVQVRDRSNVVVLRDTDPVEVFTGPVVVLINRMSASASEIFAGAMQDYGRGIIVGDSRTHGKGTVQSVTPLSALDRKCGSMKVTSASFYRITGASTQEKGVDSDILLPSPIDVMEIGEEYLDFRLPWSTTEPADGRPVSTGNILGDLFLWGLGGSTYSNQPVADLRPLMEKAKQRSIERRAGDQRFAMRDRMIRRFADKQNENEISLNLDERRAEAKEDMRMMEMEEEVTAGGDGVQASTNRVDVVLEEATRILNDVAVLQKSPGETSPSKP